MTSICGIVQRIASLPVVPSRRSWGGAHLLLVVTLELLHDCGIARALRDDREARLFKAAVGRLNLWRTVYRYLVQRLVVVCNCAVLFGDGCSWVVGSYHQQARAWL